MKSYVELAEFMIKHGGKYPIDWYLRDERRLVAMYRVRVREVNREISITAREKIEQEKLEKQTKFVERLHQLFGVKSASELSFEQKKLLLNLQTRGLF